jgi:hypothetical protein
VVTRLIAAGADVHARDDVALIMAVRGVHDAVVALLRGLAMGDAARG